MDETIQKQVTRVGTPNPHWKDLYRIGFVACITIPVSIALAVIVYFIWPYTPGFTSVESIFVQLQYNRIAGLMSLDFMMMFIIPIMILHLLALYVALKPVNESYALIALVFGIIANILILVARPLLEMVYLSNQYAAATSEVAKSQYLAAGESFHALFDGTTWLWWNIMTGISYLISCLLMLRSKVFSKATAYVGIALFVVGSGVYIPALVILSLVSTIASIIWYPMQARAFYRLGWGKSDAIPEAQ
jgi:hypothetical protein